MDVKHGLSHLREEYRLRVFQNRVLRGIFGSKKGGNRRLEKDA
jgi:hypothetical protein